MVSQNNILSSKSSILSNEQRNGNLDLLRILSCLAVLGLHCFLKNISPLTDIVYYLCGFAIPCFLISSGYILLNRALVSYNYAVRKTLHIFRLVALWNIIILILEFVYNILLHKATNISIFTLPWEMIRSLLQKGKLSHFWYFGMLIILYWLLPSLSRLNNPWKKRLIIISALAAVSIQSISLLLRFPLQHLVIQTFRIWTWIFYFMIGGFLPHILKKVKEKIPLYIHVAINVLYISVLVLIQYYVGKHILLGPNGARLNAEYFYDSFFSMIGILLFATLILRIKISGRTHALILKFQEVTPAIFIVHPLILRLSHKIIKSEIFLHSFLEFIVVLCICFFIGWILRKTKVGNWLFKI